MIQQGGLDLSVAGIFSLGAVLVVNVPGGDSGKLALGLLVALGVGAAAGLANGLAVTRLRITPLIATLGVNALATAVVLEITGGSIAYQATSNWSSFVGGKAILGIPNAFVLAVVLLLALAIFMRRSLFGRHFELTGDSYAAARAAGLHVDRYRLLAYVGAGCLYAFAGALLAGYQSSLSSSPGDPYLSDHDRRRRPRRHRPHGRPGKRDRDRRRGPLPDSARPGDVGDGGHAGGPVRGRGRDLDLGHGGPRVPLGPSVRGNEGSARQRRRLAGSSDFQIEGVEALLVATRSQYVP